MILGFLIVLCLPFWIIGGIITSVRRRKQAAISARDRQARVAREVSRMELLEEHRALLKDVSKRSAALDPSLTEYFSDKTDSEFEADVLALIGQLNSEWILELLKEGLSEVEIVLSIKSRPAMYSLAIDQTIALKTAGVSEKVLAAMVAASAKAGKDFNFSAAIP